MTDKISGEVMEIREQVKRHLEYNIAVAIPDEFLESMTDVCVKAIEEVNKQNLKAEIPLPKGITWVDFETGTEHDYMPAYEPVRIYGLTFWLSEEWKKSPNSE